MSEEQKLETSEHIVAFIDILGATKMIREDENKYLNIVSHIIESSLTHFDFFCTQACLQGTESTKEIIDNLSIKTFSDNIVISCALPIDLNQSIFYSSFSIMLHLCSTIQIFFLFEGILVRGAITKGKFFEKTFRNTLNSSLIWGTALVKAYELEQTNALFPRIIIDPKLVRDIEYNFTLTTDVFIPQKDYIHKFIIQDYDELLFIDYIRNEYAPSIKELIKNLIETAYNDVMDKISELSLEKSSNIKILQKLNWHKNYLEHKREKQRVVGSDSNKNEK